MNRAPRFCYAGTYERSYPRNRLTARALRDAGVRVEEAHVPVWERVRDKSAAGPVQLVRIALALALVYGRLVPEVALRLLRCDALVIGYIGQVDMLVLGPVAKVMRKPVIFDPLVTLTDTIVEDRALVSPRSPFAYAIALVDRVALRLADVVLADTADNADFMTERFGIAPDRIIVVPVGADEAVFYPASNRDWSDATPERPLDVLFYGKFIPLHGIETILQAIRIIEQRGVPARFELVGTGQTYRAMRDLGERLNLHTITWTDWLPEDQLSERLRRADVALGVFSDNAKAGRVVPNKVYQSLASGVATVTREKPLPQPPPLCGEGALDTSVLRAPPRVGRVPSGWRLGWGLIPPDDPTALAQAIEHLTTGDRRNQSAEAGKATYDATASATIRACLIGNAVDRVMEGQWRRQPARG